jgi:REase_AHJR-like
MSAQATENVVLERLVPDLESQGYDVFVHPNKQIVPQFLGAYAPDLIALRDDKNLVIEIKHRTGRAENLLKDLAKRFEGQKRWEFRIVWINPSESQDGLTLQSRDTISARLREISRLLDAGFVDSALLTAWATFEAVGRKLMPKEFARPQSPGRLVQVLAQEGHLTPDEGDALRQLIDMRNRFIHGELTVATSRPQVETFAKILASLANNVGISEAH